MSLIRPFNTVKPTANNSDRGQAVVTGKLVVIGISVAFAALVYGNVQLVYLAFTSQPECVPHQKQGEQKPTVTGSGALAAKSSC